MSKQYNFPHTISILADDYFVYLYLILLFRSSYLLFQTNIYVYRTVKFTMKQGFGFSRRRRNSSEVFVTRTGLLDKLPRTTKLLLSQKME